jgi:RNA recognition motif-containing protein
MEEENKIYIGNLDYGITEDEIKTFIESKGFEVVEFKIITDKFSGRSKGFGFAELKKADDIQPAIEALNGEDMNGRKLRANKALRRRERSDDQGNF